MEDAIHLAVDTDIKDIVVTGDFNYNMLNDITKRKICGICQQFSLVQCINEPTHFTETSSSLIDLVLVSNRNSIISCGVENPFLHQNIRFHCPVYRILNFSKPKSVSVAHHIWSYDRGDFDLLREKARLGACKTGLSPPSFFILTVPGRYFCCGSLLFLLSVFILWFIYYVSDIFCKF